MFQKLIYIKARLRQIICNHKNNDSVPNSKVIEKLIEEYMKNK